MKSHIVIAIDGPAGSGKSTTAILLAARLGFTYLDTGAMYRCVTLAALEHDIDLKDEAAVEGIADEFDITFKLNDDGSNQVFIGGRDVTLDIRKPAVDANVSLVASYKLVRERMVEQQRKFALENDVVVEGRDIATVVFPNADLKIFLSADLETRAIRRCRQLESFGLNTSFEEQSASLSTRDLFDSERANSPLRKDPGAVELDTSGMSINEQVEKAYELACRKLSIK
jgi:CMP/dCMP kinase